MSNNLIIGLVLGVIAFQFNLAKFCLGQDENTDDVGTRIESTATTDDEQPSTEIGEDKDFQAFIKYLKELEQNKNSISNLIATMPVGFADRRQAQKNQINSLRLRNQQIEKELLPTAIASFEKFPNTRSEVTRFLMMNLQLQLTGKDFRKVPFNPIAAQKSYELLVNGGVRLPALSLYGYRLNYLLNEFEPSRQLLIDAAKQGYPAKQEAMEDLRQITGMFQKELQSRQEDDKNQCPQVKIETSHGDMVVELFEDNAPNTVANFLSLVESDFYNGKEFFKVHATDLVATGSQNNDGTGSIGYGIEPELDTNSSRAFFTGTLAMLPSKSGKIDSQFLITKQSAPGLFGRVTSFGRVVEGIETIYKFPVLDKTNTRALGSPSPAVIKRMVVIRKRAHEYKPVKISENKNAGSGSTQTPSGSAK